MGENRKEERVIAIRDRGSSAPGKRKAIDALRYGECQLPRRAQQKLVQTLAPAGWIAPGRENPVAEPSGGWCLGSACGRVLALSVGREELRTALCAPDGRLIQQRDDQLYVDPPRSRKQDGPEEFKELLVKHLGECVAENEEPIVAVGVAWAGRVDPDANDGGGDPHIRAYHGKWEGLDTHLFQLVKDAMADAGLKGDAPVYVVNDADADLMALAHSTLEDHDTFPARDEYPGLARIQQMIGESKVILGVTIAGGVGGALMFSSDQSQRRTVQRGSHGFSGELGQIPVDVTHPTAEKPVSITGLKNLRQLKDSSDFPKWDCKVRETLDHYASGRSIIEQLFEKLEGGYNGRIRALEKRLELGDGDEFFEQVMDRSGRLIGQALTGPTLTIDPDLVVLSSFVWSKDLLQGVQHVLTGAAHNGLERKHIVLAPADPARILKGAARWAIEKRIAPTLAKVCNSSNKDGNLEKLRVEHLKHAVR